MVSGDGQAVRVWSHGTGRRIATLKGHTGRVTSVAFDDNLVVSGCSQGGVRIWGMDDLKCVRSVRTAHDGGVSGEALLSCVLHAVYCMLYCCPLLCVTDTLCSVCCTAVCAVMSEVLV